MMPCRLYEQDGGAFPLCFGNRRVWLPLAAEAASHGIIGILVGAGWRGRLPPGGDGDEAGMMDR